MERLSLPFLRSVTISLSKNIRKYPKKWRSKAKNESFDYEINKIKKQEHSSPNFRPLV